MTKPGVLFVDDNENILQGLRRNLRPMHQEWDLLFAPGGAAALKIMETKPVDVIVSDMRMPGMEGSELLRQVQEKHGHTVRFVLSGQCDEESILALLGVSHQYMAKPVETAEVIAAIKPVLAARAVIKDESLRAFVTKISSLPSLPSLQESIISEIRSGSDVKKIETLMLRDISFVAKIFQVMNSSYFGPTRDINSVSYVWEVLGMEKIKALVLGNHIIAPADPGFEEQPFAGELWELSLMTARVARAIAKAEGLSPKICDKAWVAGLLHAIGAVVLYAHRRAQPSSQAVSGDGILDPGAEVDAYPEVGFFLGVLWGLPRDICHTILYHAAPESAPADADKLLLAISHAAWALAHEKMEGFGRAATLQEGFLDQAGVAGKLPAWRTAAAAL